jgi:cytochrome c553
MRTRFLLAAALLGVAGLSQGAGDPAAGKAKAAACAACHGVDGNSTAPNFPNLAAQNPAYIVKQLRDYKSGARKNAIMGGMAAPLSDQDMEDVAAYFASQPLKVGTASRTSLSAGERLYRGGDSASGVPACMACHSPTGSGNDAARFPRLSGQHAEYTLAQLKAFRDGIRANDPNRMMRDTASRLTLEQMQALSQYMVGLY